jgi:hypothetical protein
MSEKRLQENSEYGQYDADGDGVVDDSELAQAKDMQMLTVTREKADAQRAMAWFALWGMLLYPTLIVVCSLVKLDAAAQILSEIASVYFVAIAGLVAAYFGASAWVTRGNGK